MAFTLKAADLFCGAGGASTGLLRAAKALGIQVDLLAVNHWPTAVNTHSLNHPGVRHLCQSLENVNPRKEVPGGRLHVLLAGPECTHHSSARGGRPVNEQSRATAWCVVKWAQELYIDTILIENVPEFRSWGPIGANGKPLKSKRGQTYTAFLGALRSLDYKVDERILCSADYGDPTTRQRLFIMATRGRRTPSWPAASHSRDGAATLFGQTAKWRAAREVIDWSLPGKSIFNRKKPLAPATMARIIAGLEKFGGAELEPFLVVLRQHMGGRSVHAPLPTLSAGGTHVGLVEPFMVPMYGERDGQEPRTHSVDEPVPTIPASGGGKFGVVESFVLSQQSGGAPRSTQAPLPTVATDGAIGLVQPFILANNANNVPRSIDEPAATITGGNRLAVVEPFLLNLSHGQRLHDANEPVPTITTAKGGELAVVEPFLVPFYTERPNEKHPRARSVDEPLHTITASGGGKVGVVEPFIVDAAHGSDGTNDNCRAKSLEAPLGVVTGSNRFALAEPFIVQTSERRREVVDSVDDPLRTVTALGGRCLGVAEPFITKFNGTARDRAYSVEDPLDTVTSKERFGLCQPEVNGYRLDIRFRMLQPKELAAATSFPADYQFTGNREDVVKQIGNSWTGELAKALSMEVLVPYAHRGRKVPTRRTA